MSTKPDYASEERDRKNTARCIQVAEDVFRDFSERDLKSGDVLFTLLYMVARHVQHECGSIVEREAMIATVTQIITFTALDIDKSILQRDRRWRTDRIAS